MFRPDRIGTPVIHDNTFVISTFAATWNTNAPPNYQGLNIINATPGLDFAKYGFQWNGAVNFPGTTCFGLAHQFTVTQPLEGDTVGFELNGGICITLRKNTTIFPFVAKLESAATTVLQARTLAQIVTPMGEGYVGDPLLTDVTRIPLIYQQKAIYRNTAANGVAGTYAHGFMFVNNGTAFNITDLTMTSSVRQLNDQQTVGYRDTLR